MSALRKQILTIAVCGSLGLIAMGCDGQGESGGSACPANGTPGASQRVGPFATQDTGWQRWREAQDAGCQVSEGVFPCYDSTWTRGYCFNVFF